MSQPTEAQLKKWASDQGFQCGDLVMMSNHTLAWYPELYHGHEDGQGYLTTHGAFCRFARPLTVMLIDGELKWGPWEPCHKTVEVES